MTNLVKFLMVLRSLVEQKNQRMHEVEFRGSNPQMSYLGLKEFEKQHQPFSRSQI